MQSVSYRLMTPNTQYETRVNQLDFRVTKVFRQQSGQIRPTFDVYNLLNANPVLTENSAFGRWRQPTNVLQGRLGKISLQFDF